MKDAQVHRYARHLALSEVGGLGQTAVLVSSARLVLREVEPLAEMVCGRYLAASGVGTLVVPHASDAQRTDSLRMGRTRRSCLAATVAT